MSATSSGTSPLSESPENEMTRRWPGCCRRQVSYSLILVMFLLTYCYYYYYYGCLRLLLFMWNYVSCKILVLSSCVIFLLFPLLVRLCLAFVCVCNIATRECGPSSFDSGLRSILCLRSSKRSSHCNPCNLGSGAYEPWQVASSLFILHKHLEDFLCAIEASPLGVISRAKRSRRRVFRLSSSPNIDK